MLHWHPWWMHTTDSSSRTPTNPGPLHDAAAWSPEEWLEAQARFWDRCLESNRAWWQMAAASLPRVEWPHAGVLEPPPPPAEGEAAAPASTEAGEPHKTPYAIKRRRPVASGAARAKLARQRKR
ncbi:MAG TPA: hypothetical protein VLU41_16095 [Ideonella sp.]|nr:hypothetical protein [Ideonella sp.]